jgi:hypothetical protein
MSRLQNKVVLINGNASQIRMVAAQPFTAEGSCVHVFASCQEVGSGLLFTVRKSLSLLNMGPSSSSPARSPPSAASPAVVPAPLPTWTKELKHRGRSCEYDCARSSPRASRSAARARPKRSQPKRHSPPATTAVSSLAEGYWSTAPSALSEPVQQVISTPTGNRLVGHLLDSPVRARTPLERGLQ